MAHFLAYTTVPAISIAAHTLDSAVQHILLTHLAATLYMVHPTPSSRPLLCLYHKSNVRVEIRRLLQLQAYQILKVHIGVEVLNTQAQEITLLVRLLQSLNMTSILGVMLTQVTQYYFYLMHQNIIQYTELQQRFNRLLSN